MNTVYLETSIVGYLRQRPSSQVVMAARQLLTSKWWDTERTNYELVVSQYVLDEASGGDPILASERMQALAGIPLLPVAPQITQIANEIITRAILPPKAQVDALHIATVAHHRIQYFLTWNCEQDCPPSVMLKYLTRYLTGGPISDRRIVGEKDGRVYCMAH